MAGKGEFVLNKKGSIFFLRRLVNKERISKNFKMSKIGWNKKYKISNLKSYIFTLIIFY